MFASSVYLILNTVTVRFENCWLCVIYPCQDCAVVLLGRDFHHFDCGVHRQPVRCIPCIPVTWLRFPAHDVHATQELLGVMIFRAAYNCLYASVGSKYSCDNTVHHSNFFFLCRTYAETMLPTRFESHAKGRYGTSLKMWQNISTRGAYYTPRIGSLWTEDRCINKLSFAIYNLF